LQAEIITIGDEILIGQITDTNSKWIAERLNEIGINVHQITSVQDDRTHILTVLAEAEKRVDLVIMTGGLGPTKDDITKNTLVEYFEDELVFNQEVAEHIQKLFAKIRLTETSLDTQQAMLPKKAIVLMNEFGTAAGMWFEKNGKVFVSLPGVPMEMKGLMSRSVLPELQRSFQLPFILHRTMQTYGLGESKVAVRIENWEMELPAHLKLAYLPSFGKLRLRLTARGKDKEVLEKSLSEEMQKLEVLISDIFVGYEDNNNLENVVQKLCTEKKLSLSVAESCTGGKISEMITAVSGASNFFKGGVVAYSAEAKKKILDIPSALIERHTVVSAEVAEAMAVNCRNLFDTDFAIATTGNAGPTTDKTDRSVGVVFIAIASVQGVFSEEFNFGQPREKVIGRASNKALELLKKEITKNN
jgi:nicotinamide-nucleotide amidase